VPGCENSEVRMTEDERLAEISRLTAALDELCLPYRNDDTDTYDELIKQMPETEQAMAVHIVGELEHLNSLAPGRSDSAS